MDVRSASLRRRSIVRGAAWSVPAVAVAAAAPAMAGSPCSFEWRTKVTIQAGCIVRQKHEPVGQGDCSDVSVDYWYRPVDNPDGTVTVTPWYRVIVGTQLEIKDVRAVFSLEDPGPFVFDASTVNGPTSPAQAAVPDIYREHLVSAGPPVVESRVITWEIGDMSAQSSVQYEIAGTPLVLSAPEVSTVLQHGDLRVTGVKACGDRPHACVGA